MATVTNPYAIGYDFPVLGTVFCVIPADGSCGVQGVNEAVVTSISISITQDIPTMLYEIAFKNSVLGKKTVSSTQLYSDIDSALAAYKPLVLQH